MVGLTAAAGMYLAAGILLAYFYRTLDPLAATGFGLIVIVALGTAVATYNALGSRYYAALRHRPEWREADGRLRRLLWQMYLADSLPQFHAWSIGWVILLSPDWRLSALLGAGSILYWVYAFVATRCAGHDYRRAAGGLMLVAAALVMGQIVRSSIIQ